MTLVLPSPQEYARMSWAPRMEAARRARAAARALRRKQQRKREAVEQTRTVQAEAALIMANLPREPDTVIAERHAVIYSSYHHPTDRRPA